MALRAPGGGVGAGLPTTASPGQVLKWNGTAWVPDTDLTTGGTGVLISGTATPPASGTGVNGDYYRHNASGLIWGPKAAGTWPAKPNIPRSNGELLSEHPVTFNATANAALQTALDAAGFIEAFPSNLTTADKATDPSGLAGTIRRSETLLLRGYGGLVGNNFNLLVAGWTSGNHRPIIAWKSREAYVPPSGPFPNIVGYGAKDKMYLKGVRVDGFRGQAGQVPSSDFIIGFSAGGFDPNGVEGATHASVIAEDLHAARCYIGFKLHQIQYSKWDYLLANNCHVGMAHTGSIQGGGQVDAWQLTHHLATGCDVGCVIVANKFGPWGAYTINGMGIKKSAAGIAIVQDPNSAQNDQETITSVHVRDFSYEFNGGQSSAPSGAKGAGSEGENATQAVIIQRGGFQEEGREDQTYTLNIPQVEAFVDRNATLYLDNGEFNSTGARILCMVDGPGASVNWNDVQAAEGDGGVGRLYSVRARNALARCELRNLISLSGTFENVTQWPNYLREIRGAMATPTQLSTGAYNLLSGWGTSEAVSRAADWRTALHVNFNTLQPDWSESTGNVTAGTVTDPVDGGTVSYFRFPATTLANSRAASKWLNGWASATGYAGRVDWSVTGVELYNASDVPVRLIGYIGDGSNGWVVGQNPAWKTDLVPIAFTLWPRQWQRVAIQWGRSVDGRLCFDILSPLNTQTDIYSRKLLHYKVPFYDRATLSSIMQRGLWVAS